MTNEPCPTCGHVAKKATPKPTLDGFDEFYEAFAHKRKVKSAERAWVKNKCSNIKEEVIAGAKKYAAWRDPSYKLLPATWLNEWGWTEELELSKEDCEGEYARLVRKYGSDAVVNACKHFKAEQGLTWSDDMAKIVGMVPDYIEKGDG